MIIELIGCPGAGKTTLLPTIIEACDRQRIVAWRANDAARPFARRTVPGRLLGFVPRALEPRVCWGLYVAYRGVYAVRFAVGHPKLMRHLWRTQRGRPSGANARERRVLHWYLRMMGSCEFLRRHAHPNEAIVLDEGFVHRVVQLHASDVESPRARAIAEYAAVIPEPDLVINVQSPPRVCAGRVSARGVWSHFAQRDVGALDRFVDNAHRAVSLMVDEIRRKGWAIIDVDNGSDGPITARRGLEHELGHAVLTIGIPA